MKTIAKGNNFWICETVPRANGTNIYFENILEKVSS
jgi:hypothetical protein